MTEKLHSDHRELDELFDRYRDSPKSHVFAPLADACRKAGMLEEALEICARGVGENPRYASGYVVQGKCLYDAGRKLDAQAAFDRVLDLDPKNLVALKFLGIIHAERGDTRRAREYFQHILVLDPDDREIRSRMEDVAMAQPTVSAPPVAATPAPPAATTPAASAEPIVLEDVEDDNFEGEPITLGDASVTSDEIATMTLADIYAAQGYSSRALKIYREVQKRQPDNRTLAMKIDALEKDLAKVRAAEREEAVAAERQVPVTATPEAPAPAPALSPAPATAASEANDISAASRPAPPAGHPIDPSRSYEQFKRWLKASSR